MSAASGAGRFGSGHTVRRVEDPALVAGKGRFTDDLSLPGQAQIVFLRSPYAHARIVVDRCERGARDARRDRGHHRGRPRASGREAARREHSVSAPRRQTGSHRAAPRARA